jgi:hypothetical protein
MTDPTEPNDKRRHPRIPADKQVRAVSRGRVRRGRLKDISASGAAIHTDEPFDKSEQVDLEIEDMKDKTGKVARQFDDGYAVEFDVDEEGEEDLLDDLAALQKSLRDELE